MNKHMNKKNSKEEKQTQRIDWKVGLTPALDIFIHFQSNDRHFECTMDEATACGIGDALVDCAAKKRALSAAGLHDVVDPVTPTLIPIWGVMRKPS